MQLRGQANSVSGAVTYNAILYLNQCKAWTYMTLHNTRIDFTNVT